MSSFIINLNIRDFIKKYLNSKYQKMMIIFIFPIFINYLFNSVSNFSNSTVFLGINLYDILSSLFLFIYLYFVGRLIKSLSLFENRTISFLIVFYLISFFVVEIVVSTLFKSYLFKTNFLVTNLIWLFLLILNRVKITEIAKVFFSYLFLNIFINQNINSLSKNKNIIGDVDAVFYEQSIKIFSNSYYFSLKNYVFEGYPQFISYIQSLLLKISGSFEVYNFFLLLLI